MVIALKVVGLMLLGLAVAIGAAAAAVYAASEMRLAQTVDVQHQSIVVPSDVSSIQHGQHLASAIALCTECHGPNLAGKVMLDDSSARIVASNLTRGRGGFGASATDADFVSAIRNGVDPRGRQLLLMPSDQYHVLSDADLGAIVAFARSLPPIDTTLPGSEIRPLGRALFISGQRSLVAAASIDHAAPRPAPPAIDVSPEYGGYLAAVAGCARCHGPGLTGGKGPGVPASNITAAGLRDWSDADFLRVMRTGRRPDGRAVDASMPWPYFAQMTDLELRAIWRFLQAI